MSAFKGTPGPWFAGKQCDFSGWVEIRVPGYSRNPVACATPAAAGDAEARRDSETLANALLIAAAPELLAELEHVRTTLSLLRTDTARSAKVDHRWEGMDEKFSEWLERIDSTIAKATGGDA